ncbi:MAG: universal stress protein [Methanocorpusculum sp.]|jgi:nucleotide-binding universal stress UspA family protein|nr:universal stress protein [Methanocorpusculum sp.]MDD2470798.1 universal stress protein [Methanocorpusculum sp.]MDD3256766.1 universal stress protein [Methanocorpusculum sp.]MDD4133089.1 universal stress protein [Methanocorpusculum sp.]
MFTKILVAIDGSDISKAAFYKALDMAKLFKAELHTIYVVESGMMSPGPVDTTWELIYQRLEQEGSTTMAHLVEEAEKKGVTVTSHLEAGHAGDIIIKTGAAIGCDLIVMGSLGKSKLDRLLLGSVSSHVVNYAKTNVLIVKK